MMGAIVPSLGFCTSSKEVGLELTLFALELFDFLLQCGDATQGIAMTALPVSRLLTEFEVLTFHAINFGVKLAHLSAQVLYQSNQFAGRVARATGTNAPRDGWSRADGTE